MDCMNTCSPWLCILLNCLLNENRSLIHVPQYGKKSPRCNPEVIPCIDTPVCTVLDIGVTCVSLSFSQV